MAKKGSSEGGVFMRRACRLGESSLVITLPKAWTELVRLRQGDWLYVRPRGLTLAVTPRHTPEEKRPVTVELDEVDRAAIEVYGRYVQGFDTIQVRNRRSRNELDELIRLVDRHLLGVQVVSEEKDVATFQVFSRDTPALNVLVRRLRFVLRSLFEHGLSRLEGHEESDEQADALLRSGFKLFFLGLRRLYNAERNAGEPSETLSWQQLLSYAMLFKNMSHVLDSLADAYPSFGHLARPELRMAAKDLFAKSTASYLSCLDSFLSSDSSLDYGFIRRTQKNISRDSANLMSTAPAATGREGVALWKLTHSSMLIADRATSLMETASDIRESSDAF